MAVLSLGTDVQSLRVQRSLNDATSSLGRSFERLSTGLRINSASDDAAGLAIADSLRVKARLYSGSVRNINDGISALNIIDGTLTEQSALTTRLIELAEQASNGTFSEAQRRALNTEYQALIQESGRLGDTTSFNNLNLLLGGHGSSNSSQFTIQVGTAGGSTSGIQINTADMGSFSGVLHFSDYQSGGASGTTLEQLMAVSTNTAVFTRITDSAGVSRDIYLTFGDLGVGGGNGGSVRVTAWMRGSDSNGATSSSPDIWVSGTSGSSQFDFNSAGQITTNIDYTITGFSGGATARAIIDLRGIRISGTSNAPNSTETGQSTLLNITGVETAGRARKALEVSTRRLEQISKLQGQFGAFQSRLEIARGVSEISREGTSSAESRIRDVDVADETASLVASQILQKTSASILKQSSSRAEIILGLLRAKE